MTMQRANKAVTIIGAGTQGRRLSFMWTSRGRPVNLIDPAESQLQDAMSYVGNARTQYSSHMAGPEWGSVNLMSPDRTREAISGSWLVLECIPESLKAKRDLIARIEDLADAQTIIASNSSSYTIHEITKGLNLRKPGRAVSMHSYWPPETCAIEIMGSGETEITTIETLMQECKDHCFQPFHVRQESIGYLYNRTWAAIKREALLTIAEGVATPQEIDAIFKDVLKTPKGPCEQMDVVGLDVVLNIEEHYAEARTSLPEAPRILLKQMLDQGKLGVKSGEGFYKY